MNGESLGLGPYAVIALMALATYLLRAGGLFLAGRVPLTPQVERFLDALSGSILISLVVAMALQGGPVTALAILLAVGVVLATKQSFAAIAAAVALAAALRHSGLF